MTTPMTKPELIQALADTTQKSKADAGNFLAAFSTILTGALKARREVSIPGFGKFKTANREARQARNPSTGAMMDVPAKTVAKFKPAKDLSDSL